MGAAGSRLLPQIELPKLLSAALNRLCDAVADDDANPELLETVARAADTPTERLASRAR